MYYHVWDTSSKFGSFGFLIIVFGSSRKKFGHPYCMTCTQCGRFFWPGTQRAKCSFKAKSLPLQQPGVLAWVRCIVYPFICDRKVQVITKFIKLIGSWLTVHSLGVYVWHIYIIEVSPISGLPFIITLLFRLKNLRKRTRSTSRIHHKSEQVI